MPWGHWCDTAELEPEQRQEAEGHTVMMENMGLWCVDAVDQAHE